MSETMENAPLVELIAEVKWEPGYPQSILSGAPTGVPSFLMQGPELEAFFMRLNGHLFGAGYTESERLLPANVPLMMHQPVFRFKARDDQSTKSLYQAGPGIFTANAVPPYESWSKFSEILEKGLKILENSRPDKEKSLPFISTSLRYIDAFGEKLTEGREIDDFVRNILGIKIDLPVGILQHMVPGGSAKPMLQFQIPMENNVLMTVGIGEGMANDQQSIIMDTSVATTLPMRPDVDLLMNSFDEAHKAIASMFKALIEPIKHLMPNK